MTKPIHTYLDLDVANNNLNSSAVAPQLRFEEVRNSPFLAGDSSEYFCSIVNKTVYKVTLWFLDISTRTTYTGTISLEYIPSDATAVLAQPPTRTCQVPIIISIVSRR